MLEKFTTWLLELVRQFFTDLWGFVVDAFVYLFERVLAGVLALFQSLQLPDFLANGLGSLFGQLDGGIMYLVTQMGVPQALALVGAGYAFRLTRKVATLFQW